MIAGVVHKALAEAGVPIDGVSVERPGDKRTWRVDFREGATPAQRLAAQAVIDAFDVAAVREPRLVDFEDALDRLTDQEWSALKTARDNSVRLSRWYERANTRGSIDLEDPEVKTAIAFVVGLGLFTRERLAELFGVKAL